MYTEFGATLTTTLTHSLTHSLTSISPSHVPLHCFRRIDPVLHFSAVSGSEIQVCSSSNRCDQISPGQRRTSRKDFIRHKFTGMLDRLLYIYIPADRRAHVYACRHKHIYYEHVLVLTLRVRACHYVRKYARVVRSDRQCCKKIVTTTR